MVAADALFVLIGAHPNIDWLPAEIARDAHGFLLTGADMDGNDWRLDRPADLHAVIKVSELPAATDPNNVVGSHVAVHEPARKDRLESGADVARDGLGQLRRLWLAGVRMIAEFNR
jgi:hypothetical protein